MCGEGVCVGRECVGGVCVGSVCGEGVCVGRECVCGECVWGVCVGRECVCVGGIITNVALLNGDLKDATIFKIAHLESFTERWVWLDECDVTQSQEGHYLDMMITTRPTLYQLFLQFLTHSG